MRILGGRDYYDSALAYGRDDTIIFNRRREDWIVGMKDFGIKPPFPFRKWDFSKNNSASSDAELSAVFIIFCGNFYPAICVEEGIGVNPDTFLYERKHHFYYDCDKAWDVAISKYYPDEINRKKLKWFDRWSKEARIRFDRFFDYKLSSADVEYLIHNRISIATMKAVNTLPSEWCWEIDKDTLKDLNFAAVLDPYSAMQELSMWVGGVLGSSGPKMVDITDDSIKIHKHGFDKMSFRKSKGS